MKILMLADGQSVHTRRYQAEMKKQGSEIILAGIEAGEATDIKLPRPTGIMIFDYILASRKLKDIVEEYSPDIVNPHFACGYGFMTGLSGVWKTKPVLLHCLGSDILVSPQKSFLHTMRVRYALSRADRTVVDSECLKEAAHKIQPTVEPDVIPWGADAEAFEIFNQRIKADNSAKRPLRIIVPRPHYKVYNNFFIINSLYELINDGRIVITFPKWGSLYGDFANVCREKCRPGGIGFYEFMDRTEFNKFLLNFDCYLSASRSDSSPASLIEAMAAGLYPVVADISGVREWVNENNAGLFNLERPETLRDVIDNLLDGTVDIKSVIAENHKLAKGKAVFSENIRATLHIMQEMVSHGKE